jgi:membrane protease YdiL (CAAX protease family)
MAIPWGLVLVFLVIFLAFWEKRRSLKEILSGLGLKRKGSAKSVFWTSALIPFFLVIYLLLMMISYFLGPVSFPQASGPSNGQVPLWYLYYMMIYSFFPVAVVEEATARGYMLDRLMPEHPSSLAKALPAIIVSSLLFTLYHIPSYLGVYPLSPSWVIALLAGNVFPWSIALSIAYVKAHTRNILGPILIHFLADSIPVILLLAAKF